MNKFALGVSSLVEKESRTEMLLNDMDISRLMVYAQKIEESKIREIRQEDERTRSDDSSHQRPKKRFYPQDYSMGNKDRDPNQHSQGGGCSYERARCPTSGKQHRGKCLAKTDGCFACGHKGHKMMDWPNHKSMGKDVNQASLDRNAPKKNPSSGMGARKDN
ncbi:uncharacterized protein LOC107001311 [Solanum pennellii]|uniref:Uncharacterized protein LOC107001311 n=1 Tax=Solanum pennellii TaxID=28526 RepID=A0ABM1FCH2_SOLPN|nr:uncharacterized protein LOC107001311 [Solanum pennellii]